MSETKKLPYTFDFDGVIAMYEGFKGVDKLGEPRFAVVDTMRKLKTMGHTMAEPETFPDYLEDNTYSHKVLFLKISDPKGGGLEGVKEIKAELTNKIDSLVKELKLNLVI